MYVYRVKNEISAWRLKTTVGENNASVEWKENCLYLVRYVMFVWSGECDVCEVG